MLWCVSYMRAPTKRVTLILFYICHFLKRCFSPSQNNDDAVLVDDDPWKIAIKEMWLFFFFWWDRVWVCRNCISTTFLYAEEFCAEMQRWGIANKNLKFFFSHKISDDVKWCLGGEKKTNRSGTSKRIDGFIKDSNSRKKRWRILYGEKKKENVQVKMSTSTVVRECAASAKNYFLRLQVDTPSSVKRKSTLQLKVGWCGVVACSSHLPTRHGKAL